VWWDGLQKCLSIEVCKEIGGPSPLNPQMYSKDLSHRPWSWDPTLGLIIDVQAPQATFPAAALSWVWVLRFVYLVFPIRLYNNHKYSSPSSMKTSQDEWLLLGAWQQTCIMEILCIFHPFVMGMVILLDCWDKKLSTQHHLIPFLCNPFNYLHLQRLTCHHLFYGTTQMSLFEPIL